MSFQIAPLRRVRGDFPEFLDSMKAVQNAVIDRAGQLFTGYSFGGVGPRPGQFGVTNLMPRHTILLTTAPTGVSRGFGSWSFMQRFSAPGSWVNIMSYNVPRDQVHGFAGMAFIGPNFPFNALRLIIGERTFPVTDVEEAHGWASDGEGVAIIFKTDKGEDFLAPDPVNVQLQGYQERNTSGMTVRTVPIGFMAFKSIADAITLSAPAT